jgi:hypothetical protein
MIEHNTERREPGIGTRHLGNEQRQRVFRQQALDAKRFAGDGIRR